MLPLATPLLGICLLAVTSSVAAQQARPESQGFSSERLARIAPVLRAEIDRGIMPGAVALIARNGKIVYFDAVGYLDNGKTRPIAKDSLFRAYSMTKPIVSVAAMMMVEQGRFKLNDPIAVYLPELKDLKVMVERKDAAGNSIRETVAAARPITVQDLLRHTSGFTYDNNAPFKEVAEAYQKANIQGGDGDITGDEMLKRLATIPLVWQPATTFHYSISTDVLGLYLERVARKRLDALLDEMILKPLKMVNTMWQVPAARISQLADAYEADPMRASLWKVVRVTEDPSNRYLHGGAGLVTTAHDYFRFSQFVLNGGELDGVRLLSRKTVQYMLSDHMIGMGGSTASSTGPGYGFGLGFAVRRQDGLAVAAGSTGDAMWAGAGGTSFTIDPREKIVGVFMAAGPSTRFHTRMLFKNMLYGALVE